MTGAGERAGWTGPGSTLVAPTAGNTGIALALVGGLRGYRVILVVPEGFAQEKSLLMEALGAEVVRTPAAEKMLGAIRRAEAIVASTPGAFCPQQFANPANPEVHYRTTGPELLAQLGGRADAVCLGAGSGGTVTGVARCFKERSPATRIVLVEPKGSVFGGGPPGDYKIEGIGNAFVPGTLDLTVVDEVMDVEDAEAFEMVRKLAREEGILAGSSGGAAVAASVRVAARLGEASRVATIVPDGLERYLSKLAPVIGP